MSPPPGSDAHGHSRQQPQHQFRHQGSSSPPREPARPALEPSPAPPPEPPAAHPPTARPTAALPFRPSPPHPPPPPSGPPSPGPTSRGAGRWWWTHPQVLRWLASLQASLLGDAIYFLLLSWTATQVLSPAAAGLVLAAGSLPRAALMLIGGALADRLQPGRLALGADLTRALIIVAAAVVLTTTSPSWWLLTAVALTFGLADALYLPAVAAMAPRIAPAHVQVRLQSVRQLLGRASTVAGAPTAGWLITTGHPALGFAVCGTLFTASVLLLALTPLLPAPPCASPTTPGTTPPKAAASNLSTRPSPTRGRSPKADSGLLGDVIQGLSYVRTHPVLRPLLVLVTVAELGFAGALGPGLPLLAGARSWNSTTVGLLLAGIGAGAAAAALILAAAPTPRRAGAWTCCSVAAAGSALVALATAPTTAAATVAAIAFGSAAGVASSLFGALLVTTSAPGQLGRVMAMASLASLGGQPLAYTATGVLAAAATPVTPLVIAGVAGVVLGLVALRSPVLRTATTTG